MFGHFDWHHFISAFVVLFAVIDITGNIPVILTLKKRGKKINALKAALLSLVMFFIFFYVGEAFLNLFNVDISSFAVAGSLIIFIVAMESGDILFIKMRLWRAQKIWPGKWERC